MTCTADGRGPPKVMCRARLWAVGWAAEPVWARLSRAPGDGLVTAWARLEVSESPGRALRPWLWSQILINIKEKNGLTYSQKKCILLAILIMLYVILKMILTDSEEAHIGRSWAGSNRQSCGCSWDGCSLRKAVMIWSWTLVWTTFRISFN